MAKQNGTLSLVTIGGAVLCHLTDCTLSTSTNMFDVSSKGSGGNREIMPGLSEWSVTADGFVDFQGGSLYDSAELMAAKIAKSLVVVVWSDGVVGDTKYTGNAYIESVDFSAPMEEGVTYSLTLQGTAALTPSTIS